MAKPIIGIAANEIQDAGSTLYHLPIAYVPLGYAKAVQQAGGLPFLLPLGEAAAAKDYIARIDKLVLAGGQNVSPCFYGQQPTALVEAGLPARDEFELALIEEALLQKKPIFAVCRGLQLLNVALGGTLLQDIRGNSRITHMQTVAKEIPTHEIKIEKNSMLQEIYGCRARVNSFHHQAVDRLAGIFQKTAWSSDEIIEGIENRQQRLLAVQWHPDFAYEVMAQEMAAFEYVVNKL